jgi:hypothetical protein
LERAHFVTAALLLALYLTRPLGRRQCARPSRSSSSPSPSA